MERKVVIIGAGAAGLSAAIQLAKCNVSSALVSDMPSERAQSVMAEGGINAALGKEDDPSIHQKETWEKGRFLGNQEAISRMTEEAPRLIKELFGQGMSFHLTEEGEIALRAFGGQTKKRTAYADTDTGKQLMDTLIMQVRKYEAEQRIIRYTGWHFLKMVQKEGRCVGCILYHRDRDELKFLQTDAMIMACGGLNGIFGNATGSVLNTGSAAASLFADGVWFSNLEFVQYHPTTVKLHGKNLLMTEAIRGEGGRLFIKKEDRPYYFMEEKYPELGNLMPRDVISKEEWKLMQEGYQIYLDMTELSEEIYQNKLSGVIESCKRFLHLDPRKEPIPVEPGIHYFMGGIYVDGFHRTSQKGLYAAGECTCQYHGANRLGGNSLLGALYGGKAAAQSVVKDFNQTQPFQEIKEESVLSVIREKMEKCSGTMNIGIKQKELQNLMQHAMGISRDEKTLDHAAKWVAEEKRQISSLKDTTAFLDENILLSKQYLLAEAMILCARARKESRGAHVRTDYPKEETAFGTSSVVSFQKDEIQVRFGGKEEHASEVKKS